jgi:C4-type Zn-finger protein
MSKKLKDNGLWESSRMMLPEHREELLQYREDMKKKTKPLLDEQKIESISQRISEAIEQDQNVEITVFDPYQETLVIEGKVKKINQPLKRVQITDKDHSTWIPWEDILNVE